MVCPLLTDKGPFVPVVPVESIADAVAAPITESAIVITIVLKFGWERSRDEQNFTFASCLVDPLNPHFKDFRVLSGGDITNRRVG